MKPNKYDVLYPRDTYWANVYHDSIRGKQALQELPLYIGNWAGNYTMFYVLNRVLAQYKPANILELGLGETSKFINTYLKNYLQGRHHVVEHDEKWLDFVTGDFLFSADTTIWLNEMITNVGEGHPVNMYGPKLIDTINGDKYDLYLVDGPIGSKHKSRYDIVNIAKETIEKGDEFIMILDDNERPGEQETRAELLEVLESKGIKVYTAEYIGLKTVFVIGTEAYKYVATF